MDAAEHYKNGLLDYSTGNVSEAIKKFEEAIKLVYNGQNIGDKSQLEMLVQELKQTMLKNPDDVSTHYNLGIAYHLIGYFINAIQQYEIIIGKEPKNVKLLNYIGMAYVQKKQLGKGIKSFETALNINPSYDEARVNLNNAIAMKKATKTK